MSSRLDPREPEGPLTEKWTRFRQEMALLSPKNKRKVRVIVVGSGLAGGSAAATLGELGYHVDCFCHHDSPRRAHSVAAQGGINAAKNYQYDGDSVWNLFYDTIKGGDFRSRESNVYRLAQISTQIIDQCVAQGVPFARDYGGMLVNRSFGGAKVSRTFYCRGQTGQQLLLGCYQALQRQVHKGAVAMHNNEEMLDLVVIDGQAKGIVTRNLRTGVISSWHADVVVLATGGYSPVFYRSTNAVNCNVGAAWRCHRRGAFFANPCYTQIHPTCIPFSSEHQSKLTLMSESLRNDGRIWVPLKAEDCGKPPSEIPEDARDYYLERRYPSFGNLAPRDVSSRSAKLAIDDGRGIGGEGQGVGVYLDFRDAIAEFGLQTIRERYGNLFDMYREITAENPEKAPMRIYPAPHYTMGGLWVDYHLMSTIPGLFVAGEANFSDHGANRLGASALMQGLADGYFIVPYTVGNFMQSNRLFDEPMTADHPAFEEARAGVEQSIADMMSRGATGKTTAATLWKELGTIMWEQCGMERTKEGLEKALEEIPKLRERLEDVRIPGSAKGPNRALEQAGRVECFLELGELMCRDALERDESCGGHFRAEHQTEDNEARRDDENFASVFAWEWKDGGEAERHTEELTFDNVELSVRSYK